MTRRKLTEDEQLPPAPDKPAAEMTRAELEEWRRSFRRWQRDRDVAAGRRAPRSMRETDIWLNSMRVLEERRDGRAAGLPEDELPPLPYGTTPGPLLPLAERVTKRARTTRKPQQRNADDSQQDTA